jgi:hypothetical protein
MQPPGPAEALQAADAAFLGTVVSEETMPAPPGHEPQRTCFSFAVKRVFKGDVGETIQICTPISSAACGRDYDDGEQYLVYAHSYEGRLDDNSCSRTRKRSDAEEDLAVLGAGIPARSAATDDSNERDKPAEAAPPTEPQRVPPPPIEPAPKNGRGCSMGSASTYPSASLLALLAIGWRRRSTQKDD